MERSRPATLTEVARRAGVSLTTASKAINGRSKVSQQTRARVLSAAEELRYVPNPMARSLITGRSGTVGVIVVDSLVQRFLVPVLLGAEAALNSIDLSTVVSDARGEPDRMAWLVRRMRDRKVDGVIVIGDDNHVSPSVGEALGLPVVYVHGVTGCAGDVVHVADDRGAGALAAGHLLGLGCTRIARITGPRGTRAVTERDLGVRDAVAAAGGGAVLSGPARHGRWSQRWGREAAAAVLADGPSADGVVCGSDQIASGVLDGLRAGGVAVPQQVRLVSFDNWQVFACETDPLLTSVDLELEALGAAAARDLFAAIDGVPVPGGVRSHPCSLVVRGSTVP